MSLHLNDPTLLKSSAYINGEWVQSSDQQTFNVSNPATGAILAAIAYADKIETENAINAAFKAQKLWKKVTAKERSALLMQWHDLVQENLEDLAKILTAEQGKPLIEARGEISYGANYIRWFAEEAKRIYGDTIPAPSSDQRLLITKEPIGVVACITPWNFPNAMLARKIAPALAAGNSVVCKPANETPLSAFALTELAHRAGIPYGVINVLCGNTVAIGEEITSNPLVRKLTFTGSTPVGKKLTADSARTMKRTSMELGGNAPFIIFDDADIDAAIAGLMASKFRNAGQTCVCTNRIFVHEKIYDVFTNKFIDAVLNLKVGIGIDPTTNIGPLITSKAAENVRSLIKDAQAHGAKVVASHFTGQNEGCFVSPTVIVDATSKMRVFQEEIFGPVAPVYKFSSEEDVIAQANDTPFGLAAYFYSRDLGRVWRVGESLEFGMVGVNVGSISNEAAPFGGVKESGQGREGSKYGLDDYLEIKSLCMGGLDI